MLKWLKYFESSIIILLLILMSITVTVSVIELTVILVQELKKPPYMLLNEKEMREVFSIFLMVLIGVELLETLRACLKGEMVHVEVVILVAIVAVARKIIIMDYDKFSPQMLIGMAVIILSLAGGYYLLKRTTAKYTHHDSPDKSSSE